MFESLMLLGSVTILGTFDNSTTTTIELDSAAAVNYYRSDAFQLSFSLLVETKPILRVDWHGGGESSLCLRISRDDVYISNFARFKIPRVQKTRSIQLKSHKKVEWNLVSFCQTGYRRFYQDPVFIYATSCCLTTLFLVVLLVVLVFTKKKNHE